MNIVSINGVVAMDNIISFRSQNFANNLATLMDKNAETPVELSERI